MRLDYTRVSVRLLQHRIRDQVMDDSEFRVGLQRTFVERDRFVVRARSGTNQSEIGERGGKLRIELDSFSQSSFGFVVLVELEVCESECEQIARDQD